MSLQPIMASAGRTLHAAYTTALRDGPVHSPGETEAGVRDRASPACAHCRLWGARPLYRGFSPAVDAAPEVTDADVAAVWADVVEKALQPLSGGVRREEVESAAGLQPASWNVRYQVIDGKAFIVGNPPLINHHHRKRMRGMKQILTAALRSLPGTSLCGGSHCCRSPTRLTAFCAHPPPLAHSSSPVWSTHPLTGPPLHSGSLPDLDFVVNFGDAPKVIPRPARRGRSSSPACAADPRVPISSIDPADDPPAVASNPKGVSDGVDGERDGMRDPTDCAGFSYAELRTSPHGPFGATSGNDNLLRESGFSNRTLPIFSATACCFAADLSFPTVWYDFDESDRTFRGAPCRWVSHVRRWKRSPASGATAQSYM